MSVTMEFFDGITFDIAKQKYYNANKVDARMEEIKAAFAELIEENNELRRQINDVGLSKERVAELIMGAQAKADEMIKDANAKAALLRVEVIAAEVYPYLRALSGSGNGGYPVPELAADTAAKIQPESARTQVGTAVESRVALIENAGHILGCDAYARIAYAQCFRLGKIYPHAALARVFKRI